MWKLIAWFIPGGQIFAAFATVLGAVLSFFGWLLTEALKGFKVLAKNIAVIFVALGFLCLGCVGVGLAWGIKWDAHLVKKATARMATAETERDEARTERDQWKGRLDEQTQRAGAADKAREEAEARARAHLAKSQRLRNGAGADAKAGPAKAGGPGVFGLPPLFGASK